MNSHGNETPTHESTGTSSGLGVGAQKFEGPASAAVNEDGKES